MCQRTHFYLYTEALSVFPDCSVGHTVRCMHVCVYIYTHTLLTEAGVPESHVFPLLGAVRVGGHIQMLA